MGAGLNPCPAHDAAGEHRSRAASGALDARQSRIVGRARCQLHALEPEAAFQLLHRFARCPALRMPAVSAGLSVIVVMAVAVMHEEVHEGAREQE
jgi:hypothetical protein